MAPSISASSVYIDWLRCMRVSFRSDRFVSLLSLPVKSDIIFFESYFWNGDAFLEPSIISKRAAPWLKLLISVLLIIRPYHPVGARQSRTT